MVLVDKTLAVAAVAASAALGDIGFDSRGNTPSAALFDFTTALTTRFIGWSRCVMLGGSLPVDD
jgi:hypothetical protein